MSLYRHSRALPKRFRLILASFLQRPGLPFADVLEEDSIQKAFDEEDATFADDEDAVYTPVITLWGFLSQVLFKDEHRSCVAAVARLISRLVDAALAGIAVHVVGNRPGRVEPRAIKRRPKEHALLTKPRNEARAKLRKGKPM